MDAVQKLDGDLRLVRSSDLVTTDIGNGELALLSINTGEYFAANAVGRRIWEHLESPRSARELVELIAAEYDVDVLRCEEDVRDFLHGMLKAGLLRRG